MPTTRHTLNTLRRRQAREALRTDAVAPTPADAPEERGEPRDQPPPTRPRPATGPRPTTPTRPTTSTEPASHPRESHRPLAALCLLTLLLGGFAGWAHARAESLRDTPAARNTALSDTARTSEIKGATTKAVAALFSYDHADPAAFDKAAKEWLTGRAVAQHRDLFGTVRTQADRQKAVITTTVTDSAVERVDGDRARVLVYADQSSVSTAGDKKADDDGTYAGAMLAVDLQRRDGRWLVSGIDTFGR
ncbi:hypothetical protein AB0E75_10580 [Streptomyces griseoviridis]|uniref:Membrane protein n=1 Tax=Streptomyces griseoviridis TaxID=45398 RepID=A0A918GK48_STRGD|nr:hypothetical protein [Streptomyces niveoruber]GGS41786.1 membrane protein [Streptomyces niveoruber]